MNIESYFATPIVAESLQEFLTNTIKTTDSYVKQAKKNTKPLLQERRKNYKTDIKDFGISYQSTTLLNEEKLLPLRDRVGELSYQFLEASGFELTNQILTMPEMWVQEFSPSGGGAQPMHMHPNTHVAAFYILKATHRTSELFFHDPRASARSTALPLKDIKAISYGNDTVRFKLSPGSLIISPGYLAHEFTVDPGLDPFRYVHFTMQAIPKPVNTTNAS